MKVATPVELIHVEPVRTGNGINAKAQRKFDIEKLTFFLRAFALKSGFSSFAPLRLCVEIMRRQTYQETRILGDPVDEQ